jgi:hypothetical protein
MIERRSIWTAWPPEGYASPIARDLDSSVMLEFPRMHNIKSLADGWQKASLAWNKAKKKDATPDIRTTFGYNGALCFRRSMTQRLFPYSTTALEFLPARLDDEEWSLLNCLRVTRSIDMTKSDLQFLEIADHPPWIFDVRWLNIVDKSALDWDVFCIPNSTDPSTPRRFFVTDLFVDRVHTLGLRGLDFKHVGYIVADVSQAVPKPPAPLPSPPKVSKRKPPKLTSAPLPAGELIEIAAFGAKWRQRLQLSSDASPETVLQRLAEEMQKLRPVFSTISAEERIDASLGLSAIYGELLRSACGWSWAELRESRSKRWIAVLAPSGNHALALVPYVQQQIQSEAPTVALLFNMIAAGDLPAEEPGQIRVVA